MADSVTASYSSSNDETDPYPVCYIAQYVN